MLRESHVCIHVCDPLRDIQRRSECRSTSFYSPCTGPGITIPNGFCRFPKRRQSSVSRDSLKSITIVRADSMRARTCDRPQKEGSCLSQVTPLRLLRQPLREHATRSQICAPQDNRCLKKNVRLRAIDTGRAVLDSSRRIF